MAEHHELPLTLAAAAALAAALAFSPALAAEKSRIVCWKDGSGRVIGCGDKVPPEFQGNATRELDARGVTRRTTESVDEAARRREAEKETGRIRNDDDRRTLEQKRQDHALLATYANAAEIDLKRDRDLQVLDVQLEQMTGALKTVSERHAELKTRADALAKQGKPLPPLLKDDLGRAAQDKGRYESSIENKQREKEELRARFADYRKRYTELRAQQASR